MSKIDLQSQVQGILPLHRGGNANAGGFANEMLLLKIVNDGDVTLTRGTVVARTAASPRLKPATTAGQTIIGIVVGRYSATDGSYEDADVAEDETAAVCISGRCTVLTTGTSTRWDYVRASNTDGSADTSSTLSSGTFGIVLYPMDSTHAQVLVSAAGAVTSATGAIAYATPSIVLGTAAAGGAATTVIRSDATILAFDATVPTNEAMGDSAATGSQAVAARRDHLHGMPAYATPAVVLGSSAAIGAATTPIRSDSTIAAFDGTAPVTQAFADSAAVGTAAFAARRDHKHGMPAQPAVSSGELVLSDTPSTPLIFADLVQNEAQDDLVYAD